MQSRHVERVQQIDKQILAVEKIIHRGEFNAAGVQLTLNVGVPKEDHQPELSLELSWGLDELLGNVLKSLIESRKFNMRLVMEELKDIQTFLETDKP